MKKIIALALVLVLSLSMATVAFAADVTDGIPTDNNPGTKIEFKSANFEVSGGHAEVLKDDYLSSDYFSVKVEYTKGKELVKDVKFDGAKLVLTFKDNFKLERPSISNFGIKQITLTGRKDGVAADEEYRNKKFTLLAASKVLVDIGWEVDDTNYVIDSDFDVTADGTEIAKFTKAASGPAYGTAFISFGSAATAEVRVYKDEKFFFGTNDNVDVDILKANPDADLTFLNFPGAPTFSSNASVEIFADEDTILYEVKDGKLVKSTLKYDEDALAFVGKVRTLGNYVISDVELKDAAKAEDEESKNPNTGANDFVGVAVALAVVSLVAAGAVSLKK